MMSVEELRELDLLLQRFSKEELQYEDPDLFGGVKNVKNQRAIGNVLLVRFDVTDRVLNKTLEKHVIPTLKEESN